MADKATRTLKMSDEEFDLCVALNTHSGPQTSTEMLTAARRVLVEGMEPGAARAEFVSITKQAISNVLTRLRAQYNTRIAALSPDQFELGVSVACPEISSRAKAFAWNHLVDRSGEIPETCSASALEARESIAKLRKFHLRALCAYIVK